MNHFLIFVTGSPYDSLNGHTALAFCEASVALGHQVDQVFFYQQGVQQSNEDIQQASGEKSMLTKWLTFSEQTQTPLNVCVTASLKRGVICTTDAKEMKLYPNMHPAFQAAGMADYFAALHTGKLGDSDRAICVQF